jgi:hypothetical protein
MWKLTFTFALAVGILNATLATAADLPAQLQAGEHRLVLNGSGVRTKAFMQLYAAGLYLVQPSSSAAQVLAADEPMALRVKITSGFVSQSSLVASLEEGFENATGGKTQPLREQISQFRACFQDDIEKGDTFDMVYIPGHGVIVIKNGKRKGVVPGMEFKQALYGIWLSDKPADGTLKQALLTSGKLR